MVIYTAGKYSAPTREEVQKNIDLAREWGAKLWDAGFSVINPITNTAFFEDLCKNTDYEAFLKGDFDQISRVDAVFLLPNWRESNGALREKEYCDNNNIPTAETIDELQTIKNKIEPNNNKHRIVLFTGFAQSGKSTASKILTDYFGYEELAFAEKLKYEVETKLFLGMPELKKLLIKANNGDLIAKTAIRPHLIGHGESMRRIDSYYWIKPVVQKIYPEKKYVISDCRYLNECQTFLNLYNATLIRINRDSEIKTIPTEIEEMQRIENANVVQHRIENNCSIDELKQLLEKILV